MLVLACVAVIVVGIVGASLFGLLRERQSGQGKTVKTSATPTVMVSPTETSTDVTPPAGSLFYDTFEDNRHNWSLAGSSHYFRILVNDTLILADTNPNTTLIESVPANTNLNNYTISTDFTLHRVASSDSIGLYVRGDSTLNHDYRIDINGDATFDVAKESLDPSKAQPAQTTMLVPPTKNTALHPAGQQNTLTVILLGHTLTVMLNNIVLVTVSDPSYTNGQIALFAHNGTNPGGVTVSFSRVEIDQLASPFPMPTPTLTPTAG